MKKCQGATKNLGFGLKVGRNRREEVEMGVKYKGRPTRRSGLK